LTDPLLRSLAGEGLYVHEEERLIYGYTTRNFPPTLLKRLLPGVPILFLKQVHSDRIVTAGEWRPGIEADGMLLQGAGAAALIQTADCLPLFFCDDERRCGGVLHVGWRGLQQGIEERLAERLGTGLRRFSFLLGPGIEGGCYEVGDEVREQFAKKAYSKDIFTMTRPGKHRLDIKAGLTLSLRTLGAAPERIRDCGLCTFCSRGLFPSYRRDGGTGRRIFNFLMLRGAPAAP
jgi:hypothetical protein